MSEHIITIEGTKTWKPLIINGIVDDSLYQEDLSGIHFQLQVSQQPDFSGVAVSLDSATDQTGWAVVSGIEWVAVTASGVSISYAEEVSYADEAVKFSSSRYVRWRAYSSGITGTWVSLLY